MRNRLAVAILLSVAAMSRADVTHPVCRQVGPSSYVLSYVLTGNSHRVAIFATNDSSGETGRVRILETEQSHARVHVGAAGERMYFFLQPDQGRGREVSTRRIRLEGTPNFRDIGGYATSDGHFTRWGLVYRTGVLTYLTAADMKVLRPLGVRVVCDFRTHQENQKAPERWVPGTNTTMLPVPIGGEGNQSSDASFAQLVKGHPTVPQLQEVMEQVYASYVTQYSPEYKEVFAQLEQDHLPLVYHCTAGKDRTGVFTALLLRILGVPQSTILRDYELTNRYVMSPDDHTVASERLRAQIKGMMQMFTPEQSRALMDSSPKYLSAAFAAIHQRYGSFDNYRRGALGVSDEQVGKLRARLLAQE